MIHATPLSITPRMAVTLAAAFLISACAGSNTQYPSFAIPTAAKDEARVSMRFPDVVVPQIRDLGGPVETLPAELDARLAAINARGSAAANAFSADVEATRALASAAAARNPESDSWSAAQLRLATLTSHHSDTHLALADLDALAVTAQIAQSGADKSAMIAELQTEFSQTVDEQARQLAAIAARLDR